MKDDRNELEGRGKCAPLNMFSGDEAVEVHTKPESINSTRVWKHDLE